MAFKLSRLEIARREKLLQEARAAYTDLEAAIESFNETLEQQKALLDTELEAYKEKLSELDGFLDDIRTERQDEFDAKSDNWQSSDRASAIAEWLDTFSTFDFIVDIELPEPVEVPEADVLDQIADLEVEPNY